jgi:adenylate kinase family enzyme
MSRGILICGLNGAGKTTLAREAANLLDYKHFDIEDFWFLPSDIPFSRCRTKDECISLMLDAMERHENFVLSAVIADYGAEIIRRFDFAVILDVPHDLRLARIKQREIERFGGRVLKGGDMYAMQQKFYGKCAARPEDYVEQWAKNLACPVIRVDGTRDVRDTAREIVEYIKGGGR